jgi:hypothetical protein
VDGTVSEFGNDYAEYSQYGRDGSPVVQFGGVTGISIYSGSDGLRRADAPFEYGFVRAGAGSGHEANGGDRGVVCVHDREPAGHDSAETIAAADAADTILDLRFDRGAFSFSTNRTRARSGLKYKCRQTYGEDCMHGPRLNLTLCEICCTVVRRDELNGDMRLRGPRRM